MAITPAEFSPLVLAPPSMYIGFLRSYVSSSFLMQQLVSFPRLLLLLQYNHSHHNSPILECSPGRTVSSVTSSPHLCFTLSALDPDTLLHAYRPPLPQHVSSHAPRNRHHPQCLPSRLCGCLPHVLRRGPVCLQWPKYPL